MKPDFQQQPDDPGLQKRLLLVFALTFVVILLSQPLLRKYFPAPTSPPQQQQEQPAQPPAATPSPAPAAQPAGATRPSDTPAIAEKKAAGETEVVIENDLYRITFTNRGAQVKSWVLKKYSDDKGNPLELVHPLAAPKFGYPLSLWAYDEGLRNELNSALYVASLEGKHAAPATVVFEYAAGDLAVRKSFRFDHSYVVAVETEVTRGGAPVAAFPAWPAGFGDQTHPTSYAGARIDWNNGKDIEREAPLSGFFSKEWVVGGATTAGPLYWAGPVDQYFAAIFMPEDPASAAMVTLHWPLEVPKDMNKPEDGEKAGVSVLGAAVGNTGGVTRQRLFVGPKAADVVDQIRTAGGTLEATIDWGFFGFIAKPLFMWLHWTHDHWVRNWGWAIVILTVIINVALFPLRLSSMKSAMKMAKIAPQIKAIQDKYKKYKVTDPRRAEMQQEMTALYKQHGVNPVGGCFPMLLQMPFLFAFYTMLTVAIELRHADWLWLHDLSAPDPIYLAPLAMIVSMFILQKMTPSAGMDPVQQKMMLIMMPVMLGVISWNLASGLVVYWALGNVLAIIQQMWLNRTKFGREMRAAAEARARKQHRK